MKCNVGGMDRVLRIILGLAVLSLYFFLNGANKYWSLVGLVPLLTGLLGFCPLYPLFGANTCKTK